jgi:hypothetical protein
MSAAPEPKPSPFASSLSATCEGSESLLATGYVLWNRFTSFSSSFFSSRSLDVISEADMSCERQASGDLFTHHADTQYILRD